MIVVIDYKMGNVGSIVNMLKKIGADACTSSDTDKILGADKLILPGVGAFDEGVRQLSTSGLRELLDRKVLVEKTPILGICLGMQLFTMKSEEGNLPGLGWVDGETIKFNLNAVEDKMRIPHMGWNRVTPVNGDCLFKGLENPRFYFVHSYHVVCKNPAEESATAFYGYKFTCSIRKDNITGTQFHPEKSHKYGMALLRNFAGLPENA